MSLFGQGILSIVAVFAGNEYIYRLFIEYSNIIVKNRFNEQIKT